MNRLQQLEPSATTGRVRRLLDAVQSKLGGVPNLFTNYLNHVARTVVDFPVVQPAKAHEPVACACA